MKSFTTAVLSLLAAAQYVSAHGYIASADIAGKTFKSRVPFSDDTTAFGVRSIEDVIPIKGAKNPSVNCGIGAKAAKLVLSANPGDKMAFNWRGADGSKWPHNMGPMMTYMASCGSTTCDKFDAQTAKWFKIQQVGLKPDGETWALQDLMNGAQANITLPSNIAPGQYLIRHEIIALHLADKMGGAEFYAGCTQLKIGGNGTGAPKASELVSLPGAYSDSDPGIFVPKVFDGGLKYVFPGPPVSSLASTANGTDSGSGSGSGSGSQCRLNRRSKVAKRSPSDYQPRAISRVMRNIAHTLGH